MDNNIEGLIKETLMNKKNNNISSEEEFKSCEIEKFLKEIQNSCLSQYDKDKLLQSLYYSQGGSIEYYRDQLNNTVKQYQIENKIHKANQLLKSMNEKLDTKSNSLNEIEQEITDIKSNLLHSTINKSKYNEVQNVFDSTVEKIKSQIVNQKIKNTLK
ncbi:hypothetical protein DICPUDRAFT_85371 [Dictyostelium purpureum]|uniref:Biogenesis of lysosome-related organelles complex 1 subunit 5 n=1 Tax=Dictyostelium purpureum TaxID=5786 RepID=F1A5I3_DICPU|nr:uncharacterized protein DICPUDRAFT_85371 [Dictyostelium purpureum]EGC28548.1 hypothetical protein DICPUDRAFT_85371 [Dictyostelium purpureum]|eukprot:XP_003294925.1 hypothetical protein DICPUDRAFT_85371 [Dictyostelium purpureum]